MRIPPGTLIACPECGSTKTRVTDSMTILCNLCAYQTSPRGSVERLPEHPLYSEYGWRIQAHHPDSKTVKGRPAGRG